jgi:DnaJ family protein C protein 7
MPEPEPEPEPEPDPAAIAAEAEKLKEEGNDSFKRGRYGDAIDLYSKAIGTHPPYLSPVFLFLNTRSRLDLVSTEPAYLTNRAAAYIALKRFRPALADCQHAVSLQSQPSTGAPAPPKTLLRLARCQLALAQTTAALSTLRAVLAAAAAGEQQPLIAQQATQMQSRALELEAHVRNLDAARRRGEWAMARIALDRCLQVVEAEGSETPTEWRVWRVEIELARGNWDGANSAAKYVSPLPFFFFVCFGCCTDVRGLF